MVPYVEVWNICCFKKEGTVIEVVKNNAV